MSTLAIDLPDPLDAALEERAKASGAASKEEYLLQLIEDDCALARWDQVLLEREEGPFIPLEPHWKDLVRSRANGYEA